MDAMKMRLAVYVTNNHCIRYGEGVRVLLVPGAARDEYLPGRIWVRVTLLDGIPDLGMTPGDVIDVDYMTIDEVPGYVEALSLLERVDASTLPDTSAARVALANAREALRALVGQ